MAPYIETAIQWLHDTIRVQVRARREGNPPTADLDWVALCWEVGHSLSMMQAHGVPAQPVIDAVSERLVAEFGAEGDFTPYGIRTMRQFYLDYFERPQLQPLLRAVTWDCHKLILALCRDPSQQEFYLELCRSEGLSAEVLSEALKDRRYELSASSAKPSLIKRVPKSPKPPAKTLRKGQGRSSANIIR